MCEKNVETIFKIWSQENPEPKGELVYTNCYTLLVAVALSAQATDVSVNKATKLLFAEVQTPAEMLTLGEERLKEYIRHIGLYHTKAKHVIKMAQELLARHDGEVPCDRKQLEALSGVGRKTANVVLNIGFGEPTIAVDTHIFRVSNRMGFAKGKTPLEVEKSLLKVVPDRYQLHAHHWLILHGRYTCIARKPKCTACKVASMCEWYQQSQERKD